MLGGREHRVDALQIVALETAHACDRDLAAEIDILARAFGHATPARIARNVDHRREGPVNALRRSFGRRYSCRLFNGLEVPACRFAERDGKDGAVAVDHVVTKEQRNLQPRLFNRQPLQLARIFGGKGVEDRPDSALANIVLIALADRRAGRIPVAGQQRQLPDLLVKRHLCHQLGDEPIHLRIGAHPARRIHRCRRICTRRGLCHQRGGGERPCHHQGGQSQACEVARHPLSRGLAEFRPKTG